ncbi:hypothetical protein GCM10027018_24780 [Paenibacillus thermoaerophilus]
MCNSSSARSSNREPGGHGSVSTPDVSWSKTLELTLGDKKWGGVNSHLGEYVM